MGIKKNNPGCNCCNESDCVICPDHPDGPFAAGTKKLRVTISGFPTTALDIGIITGTSIGDSTVGAGFGVLNAVHDILYDNDICGYQKTIRFDITYDFERYQNSGPCTRGTLIESRSGTAAYFAVIFQNKLTVTPTPQFADWITPAIDIGGLKGNTCPDETLTVTKSYIHCNGVSSGPSVATSFTVTAVYEYINV